MIWHEMVCDSCMVACGGFSGIKNYNISLKKMAKLAGWEVQRDGTAYCPNCQKNGNKLIIDREDVD